jgi:transcriptional regulator with XRE-family HTH domain
MKKIIVEQKFLMSDLAEPSENSKPLVGALIRTKRRASQMTLQMLADLAGISVGYLSQVERDNSVPSLGTLAQIARALNVGVDYFIAAPRTADALTRNGLRPRFSVDGASIVYERLTTDFPGSVLSSFILTIPGGYRSETVSHEGEEIVFVLEGSITFTIEHEEMLISAGDSMHFRGNRIHSWANHSASDARILWTGTLALFRSGENASALQSSKEGTKNQP